MSEGEPSWVRDTAGAVMGRVDGGTQVAEMRGKGRVAVDGGTRVAEGT